MLLNKNIKFFTILVSIFLFSCNDNTSLQSKIVEGPDSTGAKIVEGPDSTGVKYTLFYSNNVPVKNTPFNVFTSKDDKELSLVENLSTNDKGEAYLNKKEIFDTIKDNPNNLIIRVPSIKTDLKVKIKKSPTLIEVMVEIPYPTKILLSTSKSVSLKKGNKYLINAQVEMSDNSKNNNIIWSSNFPNIASINELGEVSAISKGVANITISAGKDFDIKEFVEINVEDIVLPVSVIITESSNTILKKITMKKGDTKVLLGKVKMNNGDVSTNITWESSDRSVISVNENTGLLIAVNKGTASVIATSRDDISKKEVLEVNVEE